MGSVSQWSVTAVSRPSASSAVGLPNDFPAVGQFGHSTVLANQTAVFAPRPIPSGVAVADPLSAAAAALVLSAPPDAFALAPNATGSRVRLG
jgi:hypothetical protein